MNAKIKLTLTVAWGEDEKKFHLEFDKGVAAKKFYDILETIKSEADNYNVGTYTIEYDDQEYELTILDFQS